MNKHPEIKAKGKPDWTSLYDHLTHVKKACEKFACSTKHDLELASLGAIFHDIGKVHPVFQAQLKEIKPTQPFRHEISSLLFLPLIKTEWQDKIIEMIIAHHKSMIYDRKRRGILDLDESEPNNLSFHLGQWEEWAPIALDILESFGVQTRPIRVEEAINSYEIVLGF